MSAINSSTIHSPTINSSNSSNSSNLSNSLTINGSEFSSQSAETAVTSNVYKNRSYKNQNHANQNWEWNSDRMRQSGAEDNSFHQWLALMGTAPTISQTSSTGKYQPIPQYTTLPKEGHSTIYRAVNGTGQAGFDFFANGPTGQGATASKPVAFAASRPPPPPPPPSPPMDASASHGAGAAGVGAGHQESLQNERALSTEVASKSEQFANQQSGNTSAEKTTSEKNNQGQDNTSDKTQEKTQDKTQEKPTEQTRERMAGQKTIVSSSHQGGGTSVSGAGVPNGANKNGGQAQASSAETVQPLTIEQEGLPSDLLDADSGASQDSLEEDEAREHQKNPQFLWRDRDNSRDDNGKKKQSHQTMNFSDQVSKTRSGKGLDKKTDKKPVSERVQSPSATALLNPTQPGVNVGDAPRAGEAMQQSQNLLRFFSAERMQMVRKFIQGSLLQFQENGRSVSTIRMFPTHLGSLTLNLRIQGSHVQASFTVNSQEAQKLLLQDMNHIKEELMRNQVSLDQLQVRVQPEQSKTQEQEANSSEAHQQASAFAVEDGVADSFSEQQQKKGDESDGFSDSDGESATNQVLASSDENLAEQTLSEIFSELPMLISTVEALAREKNVTLLHWNVDIQG